LSATKFLLWRRLKGREQKSSFENLYIVCIIFHFIRNNKENVEQGTTAGKKRGKQERKWDLAGTQKDGEVLDYSAANDSNNVEEIYGNKKESSKIFEANVS
jgi:hypothetical protein